MAGLKRRRAPACGDRSGARKDAAIGNRASSSLAKPPTQAFAVSDGRTTVGTVELVDDGRFVALDIDGTIIDLKIAVRALPRERG